MEAKAAENPRLIEIRYGTDLLSHPINATVNIKSLPTADLLAVCPAWI